MQQAGAVAAMRGAAGLDPYDTSRDTHQYRPPAPSGPAPIRPGTTISGNPGWEGDIGWQEANSWALKQRQQADAQYAYELGNLRTSTGLYDAKGGLIDQSKVEQLNPFSQAAMLRRAWREAQTGTLNSYAAAGQLYSGALKNAAGVSGADPRDQLYQDQRGGYNSFNYHEGVDSLKSQFNERRGDLDRWRLGVYGDIDERLLDTAPEARERWLASRPPAVTTTAPPRVAPTHGPDQPGMTDVFSNATRPPKPNRAPRQGFRWQWNGSRWVQVRRTPSR